MTVINQISPVQVLVALLNLLALGVLGYLVVLVIRVLRRTLRRAEVRKETAVVRKSLAENIREHRMACKMTQKFVAEVLGVSRQAVSKWESGASDPSTQNLLALAELFHVKPEELLGQRNGA